VVYRNNLHVIATTQRGENTWINAIIPSFSVAPGMRRQETPTDSFWSSDTFTRVTFQRIQYTSLATSTSSRHDHGLCIVQPMPAPCHCHGRLSVPKTKRPLCTCGRSTTSDAQYGVSFSYGVACSDSWDNPCSPQSHVTTTRAHTRFAASYA
jgi:hypothetical protein